MKIKFTVSGVGNLLTFLTESEKYQVGGVKFLKESRPSDNLNRGPTFLIMIEVFHKSEELEYLLHYVQRTREGFIRYAQLYKLQRDASCIVYWWNGTLVNPEWSGVLFWWYTLNNISFL